MALQPELLSLEPCPQRWEQPGLRLDLWPTWLQSTPLSPADVLHHLLVAVPWRQPEVTVYGKRHPVPRLTCWVGDPNCTYTYSGLVERPHPWTPLLTELRQLLEAHLQVGFNSLLLNRYRDGKDRMGWHADDERELAAAQPIASLSLGVSRPLRFRPRPGRAMETNPLAPFALELSHGDLLVMHAPTQRHWHHAVPPRLRLRGERLNLTFRQIALPKPL
jgi:alkylated DNA repair dioxygenase AlkB